MNLTYVKNGSRRSRYDSSRGNEFDPMGRGYSREFFEHRKCTIEDIENDPYTPRPDQKVYRDDFAVEVEVEIKKDNIWRYTERGVDILERKTEMVWGTDPENRLHLMFKEDGTELLVTDVKFIDLAKSYKQMSQNSPCHACPECGPLHLVTCSTCHGCHVYRKPIHRGKEVLDFVQIPYRLVWKFTRRDGLFCLDRKGDFVW